jgi:dihydroflavonol-4-reductase
MVTMAAELKRAYPKRRIATRVAPMVVLRLLALFDPQIKAILPAVGKSHPMSNARAREVLDMQFISPEAALRASAEWLLTQGEV